MDSSTPSTAKSNRGKVNLKSSRSRRVRIVGRVRNFTDQESESSIQPWINVCKSGGGDSSESGVTLSCSDQSSSRKDGVYRLDYCFEQDEDTSTIFSKEIKPLIPDVLNGGNASVIAYGAKGSGKTYTIQGAEAKPGLAVMAMNGLLTTATETGNAVSISILEVHQEHVYDLLDPKYSEIHILGDGQGKINLKGLTQVPVKCVSEFQNMYFNKVHTSKSTEKIPLEQPKRSHKCLMIHVSKVDDGSNLKREGKMLFIDLAGYEDARRSSRDGNAHHETTKTNMSLQAVMNVVYALNANEIHVPYRESKLTRIFQESLGGINCVVMLTCLNPQFCQDTVHTLNLASRSCQSTNHLFTNSTRGDKSSNRSKLFSSQKVINPPTPTTLKKQGGSTVNVSTKINASTTPRTLKKHDASSTPNTFRKQVASTTPNTFKKQIASTTPNTFKKQVVSTTPNTFKKQVASTVNVSRKINPSATPNTFKIQAASTVNVSAKKVTMPKGRQHFDDRNKVQSNQTKPQQGDDCSVKKFDLKEEDHVSLTTVLLIKTLQEDKSTFDHALTLLPEGVVSEDKPPTSETSLDLELKKDALQCNYAEYNPLVLETAGGVCEGNAVSQFSSELDLKETDASADNMKNNMDINPQVTCANAAPEDGEEKKCNLANEGESPPLSVRLQELSNRFKSFCTSTPLSAKIPEDFNRQPSSQADYVADLIEPKTPTTEYSTKFSQRLDRTNYASPWDRLNARSSGMKDSLVQEYLKFLNTAGKEELKGLKGIGEKRATYILELRDESPEPFKDLDDLQNIGLSAKQVKGMMKNMTGDLLS